MESRITRGSGDRDAATDPTPLLRLHIIKSVHDTQDATHPLDRRRVFRSSPSSLPPNSVASLTVPRPMTSAQAAAGLVATGLTALNKGPEMPLDTSDGPLEGVDPLSESWSCRSAGMAAKIWSRASLVI